MPKVTWLNVKKAEPKPKVNHLAALEAAAK